MTLIRRAYTQDKTTISNRMTRYISLPWLRTLYGVLLSLGAPLGWILLQWLAGRNPFAPENLDPLLYGYMMLATAFVFGGMGFAIGLRESLITDLALTDALTALYNKRYFRNRLEQEFSRQQRYGAPMSIIQVDLDHFKKVNDTYGHQAGDEVLKHISSVIMANCRKNEIPARVGGEEMSIIASDTPIGDAEKLAERLRVAIESSPATWQGRELPVTASFGVAQAQPSMDSAWLVYQNADKALYQAKKNGRNRVCCFPND